VGRPLFVPRPGRKQRQGAADPTGPVETLERSRVFERLLHATRSIQSTIPRNAPMRSSTRRTRKTSWMAHRVPAGWGEGEGANAHPILTTLYASDSTHHGYLYIITVSTSTRSKQP